MNKNAAMKYARYSTEWAERHPTIPYADYLAMREAGTCSVCGAEVAERYHLAADDDRGVLRGVVCQRHRWDLRAVRQGIASPIGVLAEYVNRVTGPAEVLA